MLRRTVLKWVFAPILCFIYGLLAAGQVLSVLRIYFAWLVLPLSLLLAALAYLLYLRTGKEFIASIDSPSNPSDRWLDAACLAGGAALFLLLIFYPLARWPSSPLTAELPWDAGLYHFPKAIEMISTHSSLDLSISYGEYPFGYETLIAFSFLLSHSGHLIGTAHALIALFLFLSLVVLALRRVNLSPGLILLLVVLIFLSQQLLPAFDSNLWPMFWPQVTLIGKNDVFLAAALLAVLLHTPFSKKGPFFPFGLAMASMIAISIKPNAALVVLFAWAVMLYCLWREGKLRSSWKQLAWSALLMAPSGLWILRNLLLQGSLISPAAMSLSSWSIASNLFNPFFFQNIPQLLYRTLAILALTAVVSIFRRSLRFDAAAALALLVTFALTPASAFMGSNQQRAEIAWRFSLALMGYVLILLLALLQPLILPVVRWLGKKAWRLIPSTALVLVFSLGILWMQRDLLEPYPQNEIALHDQYRQPVGVDGYYSAYDYVQKNVSHSVVIIENGLPFYLYDPGLTNSVTRARPAEYRVFLQTPWLGEAPYPVELSSPAWSQTWILVYEDPEGRVYKRK